VKLSDISAKIMKAALYKWLLNLWGWKLVDEPDSYPPKYIVAVAPHTSNWDFPVGVLLRGAMRQRIRFLGKHTLFYPPLGWLMRWMGGYPVDRRRAGNLVDAVVDIFNSKEQFAITITPEGTRSKATQLKTGFLRIAEKANVPILILRFDWGRKELRFGPFFEPSGDVDKDLDTFRSFFEGVKGRRPELGL
jgi:1-acyl-sn-glycerol-3-phosphate acyltransferase